MDTSKNPAKLQFYSLTPCSFALHLGIITAITEFLKCSKHSKDLLIEILIRLSDSQVSIEISHAEFGHQLFPQDKESSQKAKMYYRCKLLKNDQRLSNFCAVWIDLGTKIMIGTREIYSRTKYS